MVRTGLESLLAQPKRWLRGERVGLVANATTVDSSFKHAVELLFAHADVDLKMVFAPEHGLYGAAQDMEAVADTRDPLTGVPVVSLYGSSAATLGPSDQQLVGTDVLVFDIQDVGARYYTYAATMALCMRAAKRTSKRVVVLDRPNPIGGVEVEGGGIDAGLESFVGLYPIPQRHGMTVGELARLYNTTFGIGCELEVVTCEGWYRHELYDQTGLPWVMPSPNMPTLDTALVYPGMCLLEGTNFSEGRGTTRPFELFGAPSVDGRALARELSTFALPGVEFRPCEFKPMFHKYAGRVCGGVQLRVTDREPFLPYQTGLAVLVAARRLWPEQFGWRTEVYEFRSDVPAIDLLTGSARVRAAIDGGETFEHVVAIASSGTESYESGREAALLY